MANTNDGLLIVGVTDGPDNRPGEVVGVQHAKPAEALRTWCAGEIEPPVPLEIEPIRVPPGEKYEGAAVVVIRIRRGSNPPYLLRTKGVYVRNGDQDRHASVRELQALFDRRAEMVVPLVSPWVETKNRVFGYLGAADPRLPVMVAAAVTPVFPLAPVVLREDAENTFAVTMLRYGVGTDKEPFLEPNGVSYISDPDGSLEERAAAACAFNEGSIGLRRGVSDNAAGSDGQRNVYAITLLRSLLDLLTHAEKWPRTVCGSVGPLHYVLGVGNIANTLLVLEEGTRSDAGITSDLTREPQRRNSQPSWMSSGEWDHGSPAIEVVERDFELLARQLQCRFYPRLRPRLRQLLDLGR